jgi:hypothetical protein
MTRRRSNPSESSELHPKRFRSILPAPAQDVVSVPCQSAVDAAFLRTRYFDEKEVVTVESMVSMLHTTEKCGNVNTVCQKTT